MHEALIAVGRAFDTATILGPVPSDGEIFSRDALQFLPGKTSVPVAIDHDITRTVGQVHGFVTLNLVEGTSLVPWIVARCTLDDPPPPWLKPGTRASLSHKPFEQHTDGWNGWTRTVRSHVVEVSVLLGKRPREPLARVLLLKRTSLPAAKPSSDRGAAGEIIEMSAAARAWADAAPPGMLRRPGIGRVLGVR